ncbi:MAG: ester cyclase [Acidobacteriota bacterium]|nr:ester cyclase [Acidobacteriota bacterium]
MKKLTIILVLLFSAVIFARAQALVQCDSKTEEQNKVLARKFYERVWFSNNPAAVDEIFAPEYIAHDIGDRKGVTEPADEQKKIAAFFWNNGNMRGTIDYQIAECDLVATRWQWKYQPTTWWIKMLGGSNQIPIVNVFRFKDGKIVEIWNHRHDIDTAQGNIPFVKGLLIGLIPSFILLGLGFILWRKLRQKTAKV